MCVCVGGMISFLSRLKTRGVEFSVCVGEGMINLRLEE